MHIVAGLCDDHRSSMYEMLGIGRKGKLALLFTMTGTLIISAMR